MSSKSQLNLLTPDFSLENQFEGRVCGIDEVGRGPLAGPVVAACVYIPEEVRDAEWMDDIKDSKKIAKPKLGRLYDLILESCICGMSEIYPAEIDEINILQASLKAMEYAFDAMTEHGSRMIESKNSSSLIHHPSSPWHALIDGNRLPTNLPCPATTVIKGDSRSKSIAAASIIAKVTRDRIMKDLAQDYPGYSWETNAGYGSKAHMEALKTLGVTPHHRRSFAPVRAALDAEMLLKAS